VRKGTLRDLIPIPLSVLAAGALALLLPARMDPLVLVAKILAVVAGAGVVLATSEALVARLQRRTTGFRWELLGAGLASAVAAVGLAHATLPPIEGTVGEVARWLVLAAIGLSAAHGGITLASIAGRPLVPADGWRARPVQSAVLRGATILFPILASFAVAITLNRTLPSSPSGGAVFGRIALVLFCSYVTLFLTERLVRRLGPLTMLLKLSLTFPGDTPSRYAIARRSRNPHALREQLERARRGDDMELARVAETILALATALTAHDSRTRGHSERVRVFTDMLAEELRLPRGDRDRLRWAALMHDIGKLSVSRKILNKAGPLDKTQWRVMERHPEEGARLVQSMAPWLGAYATAIAQHHERYDGRGYPAGVAGEDLTLGARIISVADSYDTMTAARPYKAAMTAAAARQEVERCAGSQFDPVVVRALLNLSIRRLWWRMGVASWLAQLPLLGRVPQAVAPVGELAATGMRTAAAVAGVAAATALPGGVRQTAPMFPRSDSVITIAAAVSDSPTSAGPGAPDDHPGRGGRREAPADPKSGSGGGGRKGGGTSGGGATNGGTKPQPPTPSGGSGTTTSGGGTTSSGGTTNGGGGNGGGKGPPAGVDPPGLQGQPPPGLSGGTPPGHLFGGPGKGKANGKP
jgi:putative nucleotidyltransferase with HDIG domain